MPSLGQPCVILTITEDLPRVIIKYYTGCNTLMIYYTYVLYSLKDEMFYTGYTSDLDQRLNAHNNGEVASTKYRRPLKLIYYEACFNQQDASHREKYLKTTYGKRYIKNRLNNYLLES